MAQRDWKIINLWEETYDKVRYWANHRGTTLAEAVDFAFDNLGPLNEEENDGSVPQEKEVSI